MTKRAVEHLITNAILDPVTGDLVGWFERTPVETLIIENNPFEIHGLAWNQAGQPMIAVEEQFENEFLPFLHEIGHVAMEAGFLTVDDILERLEDEHMGWFTQKANRYQTKDMEEHYALRAIFRQNYPQRDLEFTQKIKGRFSTQEAVTFLHARFPGMPIVDVLREFAERQNTVQTRAQEEALLIRLGEQYRFDMLKREKQFEELKIKSQRGEEVKKVINEAFSLFVENRGLLPKAEALAVVPLLQLFSYDADAIAVGVVSFIQEQLASGSSLTVDLEFEHFFVDHILGRHREALSQILGNLYVFSFQESTPIRQKLQIYQVMKDFVTKSAVLSNKEISGIQESLLEDILRRTRVSREEIPEGVLIENYFEQDSEDPDILYFREDFREQLARTAPGKLTTQLEVFYRKAIWNKDRAKEFYLFLSAYNRELGLREALYQALLKADVFIGSKVEIFEMLVEHWNPRVSKTSFDITVRVGLNIEESISQDSVYQIRMLRAFQQLARHDVPLITSRRLVNLMTENISTLNESKRDISILLREKEAEYQRLKKTTLKKRTHFRRLYDEIIMLRYKQDLVMQNLEVRLQTLGQLAQNAARHQGREDQEFSEATFNELLDIYRQSDVDVKAEIVSGLARELRSSPIIAKFFEEEFAGRFVPYDEERLGLFLSGNYFVASMVDFLKQSDPNDRVGFLVLSRHSSNKELLLRVIFDKAQPDDDDKMPTAFRLYAASLYAAQFLRQDQGEEGVVYDEMTYQRMIKELTPLVGEFISKRAKASGAWEEFSGDIFLRDQLAQVDAMAILFFLQASLSPEPNQIMGGIAVDSFSIIASGVTEIKMYGYRRGSNAALEIGGKLFEDVEPSQRMTLYFQILAHEIMHKILFERGLQYSSLRDQSLHEFIADQASHLLSDQLFLEDHMTDVLGYHEDYISVKKEGYYSSEAHRAARGKRVSVEKAIPDLQRKRQKFLMTALQVIDHRQ
ncbi:MAG: hypothetical protein NUV91_06725, partial [Candidatus Omnitrophica bacterium]|nr:hypothetical protein [Candidatus Omnitrophota bacterium]